MQLLEPSGNEDLLDRLYRVIRRACLVHKTEKPLGNRTCLLQRHPKNRNYISMSYNTRGSFYAGVASMLPEGRGVERENLGFSLDVEAIVTGAVSS